MKNNLQSKISKSYPLLILVGLTIAQLFYSQWRLETYRNDAEQDEEILYKRLTEDNIPSNIKQHISYIQNQATFNTSHLVSSLTSNQILFQLGMILVVFKFYSGGNRKVEDEQSKQ